MLFCFVDESGTPPSKPSPKKPYFTLGAAIIDIRDWKEIANKILGYKLRHRINGELKWRYFSPHNSDKGNPLLAKTGAERIELSDEFAGIIAQSNITLLACVTDVEAAFSYGTISGQQDLYHFAYKPISERFQYHLQDKADLGIVVSDHRGRDSDKMFRAHHDTLINGSGAAKSGYDRLIEGLFLQDSEHSIGIQIADFVAGAVHRAYSRGDGSKAAIFKKRMRGAESGNILGRGIVLHPKSGFRKGLR